MAERDRFINENMGLVHLCVQRYTGRGMEYDDLFQVGCLGLIKAYDRFDSSRGLKFSTYAVPVILGEIRQLFRESGSVKIGRALKELSLKAAKENENYIQKNGKEPTINELAQILKVEPEQAALAINASMPVLSLTYDEDDGGQADIKTENFDGSIIDLIALRQVMGELEPEDKTLILLRYFKSKTQSETAAVMGMTQVQVSRREKKIIEALRRKMIT